LNRIRKIQYKTNGKSYERLNSLGEDALKEDARLRELKKE